MLACMVLAGILAMPVEDADVSLPQRIEDFQRNGQGVSFRRLVEAIDGLESSQSIDELWELLDWSHSQDHRGDLDKHVVAAICRLGDEGNFRELVLRALSCERVFDLVEKCAVIRALSHLPASPPLSSPPFDFVSASLPDDLLAADEGLQRAYWRYQTLMDRWFAKLDAVTTYDGEFEQFRVFRSAVLAGDPGVDWRSLLEIRLRFTCGNADIEHRYTQGTAMMIDLLRQADYDSALALWMRLAPSGFAQPFYSPEWRDGFLRLASASGQPPDELLLGAVLEGQFDKLLHFASVSTPRRGSLLASLAEHIDQTGTWQDRLTFLGLCSHLISKGPSVEGRMEVWVRATRFEFEIPVLPAAEQGEILDWVSRWALEAEPSVGREVDRYAEGAASIFYELGRSEVEQALRHLSEWSGSPGQYGRLALQLPASDGPDPR